MQETIKPHHNVTIEIPRPILICRASSKLVVRKSRPNQAKRVRNLAAEARCWFQSILAGLQSRPHKLLRQVGNLLNTFSVRSPTCPREEGLLDGFPPPGPTRSGRRKQSKPEGIEPKWLQGCFTSTILLHGETLQKILEKSKVPLQTLIWGFAEGACSQENDNRLCLTIIDALIIPQGTGYGCCYRRIHFDGQFE
eukprot:864134-Amphidinium_carterae.1